MTGRLAVTSRVARLAYCRASGVVVDSQFRFVSTSRSAGTMPYYLVLIVLNVINFIHSTYRACIMPYHLVHLPIVVSIADASA